MVSRSDPKPAKYFAFVSYAHADEKTAARLARYLETFRVPVRLGGPELELPRRMTPIFRDRDEFSASSDLGTAITEALASSRALIVLCSPSAAKSRWVNEEIRTFRRLGSSQRVFAVLVEGEPHEAFPAALLEGGREPLAIDFRRVAHDGKDARLRLVAALLGIDFDALKRRERLRVRGVRVRIAAAAAALIAALLFGGVRIANLQQQQSEAAAEKSRNIRVMTSITAISLPTDADAFDITSGPDGALWFTDSGRGEIDRIDRNAVDGSPITKFSVRNGNKPDYIVAGPDGALWFTEHDAAVEMDLADVETGESAPHAGRIGKIDTRGKVTDYQIPTRVKASGTGGITVGPDGALWFTESEGNKIARITITGKISEFPLSVGAYPGGIALGSDGALWFTESKKVGRITAGGKIVEFQLPTLGKHPFILPEDTINGGFVTFREHWPGDITLGPDGALWFTERHDDRIGRIDTAGRIAEFRLPTTGNELLGIATGPDGALWFSEGANVGGVTAKLGRITTTGKVEEFLVSAGNSITTDREGVLWFTGGDKIGRITGASLLPERVRTLVASSAGFTVIPSAKTPDPLRGQSWIILPGSPRTYDISNGGYLDLDPTSLTDYRLPDGREVIIVPLDSGTDAGGKTALVYAQVGGELRYVRAFSNNQRGWVSVSLHGAGLHVTKPLYSADDAQCCASRERVQTFSLVGSQFVKTKEWIQKSSR